MRQRAIHVLPALLLLCAELSWVEAQERGPAGPSEPQVLSLDEAVHLALRNNLNLMSSADSVASAQISQGLAESRFGVKLTPSLAGGFGSAVGPGSPYGFGASKLLPYGATGTASAAGGLA